jgi:hypothetical protein
MVMPGHEPMAAADRVLTDRLVAELKKLVCDRPILEAVILLTNINAALAERDERAKPVLH